MRRLLPVILGILVVVAGLYGSVSLFSGRDSSGVSQQARGPGDLEPLSTRPPRARGEPPTSGRHRRRNVTREGRLGVHELLTALDQGNVVLVHPAGSEPPPALLRVQEEVSGPFDPELAAAGQMVLVTPWPAVDGIQALAHRRRLRASGPSDARLRAFAEAWLGQGEGNTG